MGYGKARIQRDGLELQVEDKRVVDEFLNVKWDLKAVGRAIIRKVKLDGNVLKRVAIGVDVVGD
jgi:hypothetical protein